MFGFPDIKHGEPEDGSEERYYYRKGLFVATKTPMRRHNFWWFVHNCIAHPLIGICPIKTFFRFHDWTSHKIMGE